MQQTIIAVVIVIIIGIRRPYLWPGLIIIITITLLGPVRLAAWLWRIVVLGLRRGGWWLNINMKRRGILNRVSLLELRRFYAGPIDNY